MPSEIERVVARVAPRQRGLITRRQLLSEGIGERVISYHIGSGHLFRLHAGVYRVAGAPSSWRQSVLAATLSAGPSAAASGLTAAALWGLSDARGPIELTVPFTCHPKADGFVVHRTRRTFDPVTVDGIPATPAVRTLEDLARTVRAVALEEVIDQALFRRLVKISDLETSALAAFARGRRAVPESVLETRFLRIVRDGGLPLPIAQFEIHRGATLVARVDFAYPAERIAIELDGYRYHSGRTAFDRGHSRQRDIQAAGFLPLVFTSTDLSRPKIVGVTVRRFLFERGHPDVVSI